MNKINVMLDKDAIMPTRAHLSDAGLDLYTPYRVVIWPHDSFVVDTGVHIEIPDGYVGMIKSKSGLNINKDIVSEGVVDAGYTGQIKVKLYNHGDTKRIIEAGDKITQLVIMSVETPELILVNSFKDTERGDNGFGSTGR